MPPTIVLIAIAILGVIALVYGYRALTAFLVFRSLPSDDADGPSEIVDGATVALTGEVEVEQPVESGDAAVEKRGRSSRCVSLACSAARQYEQRSHD